MSYYAKGLKELIQTVVLNEEFFLTLSEFQLHFLEACFMVNDSENMGLKTEIELENLEKYKEFKEKKFIENNKLEIKFKKVG